MAVCFTALAHTTSTRRRSTTTCGMPGNNIRPSNRTLNITYIMCIWGNDLYYIDRSVRFFVSLYIEINSETKTTQLQVLYYFISIVIAANKSYIILSDCSVVIDPLVHASLLLQLLKYT